ncbi:hypothetical protein CFIO01_12813 [Colletotrichum fioriniae PJ7]|uniref:Uncharacterized protein n=1 Tax=Colletotrichum fioriniae PJ7 TaxID=1445577 RepID=A0A010RLM2_9PEZI|nr:hypothetical protein CFIO01_12813 [Colletotrichum fioriniae PJ7]
MLCFSDHKIATSPRLEKLSSSPHCNYTDMLQHGTAVDLENDKENHAPNDLIVPPPKGYCACIAINTSTGPEPLEVNVWRAVNEALSMPWRTSTEAHVTEDAKGKDTIVRALIEGWDVAAKFQPLSDLWIKLRRVDELCFQACPRTERLAILWMASLQLRYHSDPTTERKDKLPPWYWKRPGVRERFVFEQHKYCDNQFWKSFARNFRLLWSSNFQNTYAKSSITGLYEISPSFEQRISDINIWTMKEDFFNHYPEFRADIPPFRPVAQHLNRPPTPAVVDPIHPQSLPQQASPSQFKVYEEPLLLGQQASAATNNFDRSDHGQCLWSIGECQLEISHHPEWSRSGPSTVEIDTAVTEISCPERSTPSGLKREANSPLPLHGPDASAVPHHMTTNSCKEGYRPWISNAKELGRQVHGAVGIPEGGTQQLSGQPVAMARSFSPTAFSGHPVHYERESLKTDHRPPEQLLEPPDIHYFAGHAQATGDADVAVACSGFGKSSRNSAGVADIELTGDATQAWTPEELSNQYPEYTGAFSCGEAPYYTQGVTPHMPSYFLGQRYST